MHCGAELIKEKATDWARSKYGGGGGGGMRKFFFFVKREGKRPLRRPRHRWEDNSTIHIYIIHKQEGKA
jgi:hypothetical protein